MVQRRARLTVDDGLVKGQTTRLTRMIPVHSHIRRSAIGVRSSFWQGKSGIALSASRRDSTDIGLSPSPSGKQRHGLLQPHRGSHSSDSPIPSFMGWFWPVPWAIDSAETGAAASAPVLICGWCSVLGTIWQLTSNVRVRIDNVAGAPFLP